MYQLNQFAQAASYNCEGSADNTYGAGEFGTCGTTGATDTPTGDVVGSTSTSSTVGAPNTGELWLDMAGGTFSIVMPVIIAIIIVVGIVVYKKRTAK